MRADASLTHLDMLLEQLDEQVGLDSRHAHKLAHTAEHDGLSDAASALRTAQAMLVEARSYLDEARQLLDAADAPSAGVDVHLV